MAGDVFGWWGGIPFSNIQPQSRSWPVQQYGWMCPRCKKVWSPHYYGACDCEEVITHSSTASTVVNKQDASSGEGGK